MSTPTAAPPTTSHAATPPDATAAQVHPTFGGIMRGEWIKLVSLRSTWWTLASTAAVITLVALAAAASLNTIADDLATAPTIGQMHGAEVIASGFHFGMLTIAVLGALLFTGEYSTGMIRSTFAAVPTRIGQVLGSGVWGRRAPSVWGQADRAVMVAVSSSASVIRVRRALARASRPK